MRAFILAALVIAFVYAQPTPGAAFTNNDCLYYCGLLNSTQVRTTCNVTVDSVYAAFGYVGGVGSCVAACQAFVAVNFPSQGINLAGFVGNTSGNSMGCRLYHAEAIITAGVAHCPHATIHGGGPGACVASPASALVDSCTTWCTLLGAACPETYLNGTTFAGYTCGLHCAASHQIPTSFTFPVSSAGDNMACHQYHGTAALFYAAVANVSSDRILHCSHASPLGGGVCGDATSQKRIFCNEVAATCTGNRFPYSSAAQCLSDAGNYSVVDLDEQFGPVNADTGDSLACRFYHGAMPSVLDPTTHCPHTAWSSAPCGNRPTTAAPTTAAPTTAAPTTDTNGASSLILSVVVVLAALLIAF